MERVRFDLENTLVAKLRGEQVSPQQAIIGGHLMRMLTMSLLVTGIFLWLPQSAKAGTKTSQGAGNWTTITWSPAGAPSSGDDVIIRNGDNVVLNTNTTIASLQIGQGTSGQLTIGDNNTNRTLTVSGNVTVNNGATFDTAGDGGNSLLIAGTLTNSGTFDMKVGANSTATVTFNGTANQTVSGSGGTTDFSAILINNTGATNDNIVEVTSTNFTAAASFLTLTDGIFKVSGSFTISNTFFAPASYNILAGSGLWLNNSNVTVTAQNGSPVLNGSIQVTNGTYNIGTNSGNSLTYNAGSSLKIEGGAMTIAGRFIGVGATQTTTFTMSGGTLTVASVGNASNSSPSFDISAAGSSFTMSGGSIVLQLASTAGTPIDYRNIAGTVAITGGTVQFGNATTANTSTFRVSGTTSVFPNLSINNATAGATKPVVLLNNPITVDGDVTIASGTTLNANGQAIAVSGNSATNPGHWSNNGTFTPGTQTTTFNGSVATQTISGGLTTGFSSLTIANGSFPVAASKDFSAAGTLTISAGAVLSPDAAVVVSGAGTLTGNGTAQVKRTAATADFSSQYTITNKTLTNLTVEYVGAGAQTVSALTYGGLKINNGSGATLAGNVSVGLDLNINAGTLDLGTNTANRTASGGTLTVANGAGLKIGGTNSFPTNYTTHTLGATSTVEYAGTSQTVSAETYGNLSTSGSGTKTLAGTITVSGGVTVGSGTTLDVSGSNFAMNVGGDWTNNGGTFTPQAGTVTFNSTTAQAINGSASTQTFNKITVNKSAQTLSVGGSTTTLTVNSDLTITAGGFDAGSATTINIGGIWTNDSATGFTSGSSNVVFNGSAAQIAGSQTTSFKGLTVGHANGVTITTSGSFNTTVTGVLALTSGDLITGSHTLAMGSGAPDSTGNGDVVGNVNRLDVGGTTRSFGNVNVKITETAGTASDITVNLVKGASSLTGSVLREYGITVNAGTNVAATLRLRYLDGERQGNGENSSPPCTLQLWKKTGTTWSAQGSTSCDSAANWVELTLVPSFSQWTLKEAGAPTACKLESFNASRSNDGVVLEWHTGLEVDNIGFNVYKETEAGKPVRLTPHLVAGSALMVRRGTMLTAGLGYSWTDPDTKAGESPRYWLEDLDISGQSTWSGPFWIDENRRPSRSLSPLALRSPMINSGDAANSPMINAINAVNSPMINTVNSATINAVSAQQFAAGAGQSGQYEATGQAELKAGTVKLTGAPLVQQINLAGQPAVKISVRQEGYYRVNQPDLLAAGLDPSVDPRKLQLYVDGVQIPMIVRGESDGNFGPQDSIEFYGLGLDTASTDTHVYWLIAGAQPGNRIKPFKGASGAGSADSFPYTVQRKDRLYYFSNIPNGDKENFFGAFIYYQPTDQTLSVNHIAPAATASLEVAMQGFNVGKHHVAVSVNGALIGNLDFNDQAYSVSTLTFSQSLLTEGANTITMVGQAGNSDFSFVDYMKLTYSHSYNADANALKFTAGPSRSVTVNGFSDPAIRVMDVTDPASPQEMLGRVSQTPQGYSVTTGTTGGTATRTLMVFLDAQAKPAAKVAANRVSNLRQASNTADLLMVSYGDFSSSFQSLKTLRASQGLETQIVDIEDVYDEFNGGNKSPQALKDFLSYARTNWKKAPKYVLLGGTASFDPRNYLNVGATDFVPTMFVQTQRIETASDDAFADFNNDGIPEMAVGRLPARTTDEAARMVQKVISYDQAQAGGTGVLLVADVNNGFDFEANNDQLTSLVPKGTPVQDIRRGSDPQAKQNLLDALNLGKKLVNYTGHGSVDIWEANLLTDADAATLVNAQKLSVVVAMTCLNGYFIDERIESLAHALLNAPNGGAVAMWSSSGLTLPDAQADADFELFRQLFSGTSIRLGDATIRAKTAISDIDVRRTWILIGDPTTRFRQ